ncbi:MULTISPECIES: hypothetical protein [unclassified Bacillus (in: firmicutes)]|uniref:hypothetical protein n=1 Tax=unclassified Bacillus (in: firmicutes) TaxID=185979 RepID=UPI0008E93E0B|nr:MULTISPECIES: hypothetical protein [unclassified Bacillus (in: firmicutes)]SFA89321.1 hypothetical protein SAMN02799634_102387 [Bacillus sp. UNCCL13]SFQ84864.1 hypothetical protein SAMN04488577_2507 [Bacillus sp. cl95]
MKQALYGLLLFVVLSLPPVADFLESIMIMHMHMQMPLLVISGILIARFFQIKFPGFFEKWNGNGVPGMMLFIIIISYWMLPRAMDEALNLPMVEVFKFISLPFLAGVPLRDSWVKLSSNLKNMTIVLFAVMFIGMGWLFIMATDNLCNSYLVMDQIILGWGYITMAICLIIYLCYCFFIDPSDYE